jgi:tubulin beta
LDPFFKSIATRWQPRLIVVTSDPTVAAPYQQGTVPTFPFSSENAYVLGEPTGNNWAKGHYTTGWEIRDTVLAGIAREVDEARANGDVDLIFNVIHTLGGGTGSGLGTLLLQSLKTIYPQHIVMSTAVLPSPRVSDTVVEPYNAMLSLGMMRREGYPVLAFDNEVLLDVCIRQLGITMPTYRIVNRIITGAMVGLFAPVMAGQATALRVVHGMMQNRRLTKVNKARGKLELRLG